MSHILSIKTKNGTYKYHEVDRGVYMYVKQLENGIRSQETRQILRKDNPVRFRK